MSARKRGLGRGLDALLATQSNKADPTGNSTAQPNDEIAAVSKLPIEKLQPGKYQPRKDMSPDALEELAASIKTQGIIQPIIVRPVGDDQYEIIAGERRWRASQIAQLDSVPVIVKDVPDEAAVAIALIENIQREDLNAMEEAIALQRLQDEFELTHQEVADAVGKSRTSVTNYLRLNKLEDDVKTLMEHGDLEFGHAKVLLGLGGDEQVLAARKVVAKELTVRETEKLVNSLSQEAKPKAEQVKDPDVKLLEQQLVEKLGAKVEISYNRKGKGKMVISYTSLDELDGILNHLK
ncbi:ParB/RepB/Spo0J family partition protein [Psychrosphaera sp. B3R10]|uniref:Probable chromosome-partitioning protein ParB n=1 Tax=Psychrosphaera algicola TaxID=3023714 RepID=A0ABT5FG25_9GAMM|nr:MULTISPECIES: ParB/RepB/Spo0J family partition protein [unclassified Psychrosphaera]MBU2883312.1 ParB/RepB/Spo0J family partition protein [Psychrosphaera sp. I2R16]MBU2990594.1 ParB/RepB/Spo0J family partition protein [Psychrosphaera sp. B3R10]MDC2889843.1 ParB/RepB/Spo0J family partition protein [Psychrosphaera sp. G1-22]MDO6718932.1 ParB/RepB/Spo0J family partition protein [Psychrosphaera sp. 1_MG-2023]